MKRLLALSILLALTACGISPETIKQHEAEVAEDTAIYANQLVTKQQPYATISAQPRKVDQHLIWSPYQVHSIDGKVLARQAYSFTRAKQLPRDRAFSQLKVPVGFHDLEVYGGYSRPQRTFLKNVKFEADGKYVIVEKKTEDDDIEIFIAEYKPDTRFQPKEAEFYIVGKAVTPRVALGGEGIAGAKDGK